MVGIEGHRRARPVGEGLLHRGCRPASIVRVRLGPSTGCWRSASRHLDAAAVDDHAPVAVLAHQAAVVAGLDARLADQRARAGCALVLGQLELAIGDLAHSSEGVGGGRGAAGRSAGAPGRRSPRAARSGGPRSAATSGSRGVGLEHHRAEAAAARQPLADLRLADAERSRELADHALDDPRDDPLVEDHVERRAGSRRAPGRCGRAAGHAAPPASRCASGCSRPARGSGARAAPAGTRTARPGRPAGPRRSACRAASRCWTTRRSS